jgi:branched-chain amino acid aminotransferase
LQAGSLKKILTTAPKKKTPQGELVFGRTFSDHMLVAEWDENEGWSTPEIKPFANISLAPSAAVLHYAVECFEGLKAYRDKEGKVRLFRPEMNVRRLLSSAQRLMLPVTRSK